MKKVFLFLSFVYLFSCSENYIINDSFENGVEKNLINAVVEEGKVEIYFGKEIVKCDLTVDLPRISVGDKRRFIFKIVNKSNDDFYFSEENPISLETLNNNGFKVLSSIPLVLRSGNGASFAIEFTSLKKEEVFAKIVIKNKFETTKNIVFKIKSGGNDWSVIKDANMKNLEISDNAIFLSENILYFAYKDSFNNDKITLKKLENSKWSVVGRAGFSSGSVSNINIFVRNKNIYTAFKDGAKSGKASVMKYSESGWEYVGIQGFSEKQANYISFYGDKDFLYLAFQDAAYNNRLSVMKYSNDKWEYVGNQGISLGEASYVTIFALDKIPYVGFSDGGNEKRSTVYYFKDEIWRSLGTEGFSEGEASYNSIFTENENVYLGFRDNLNSKIRVAKYKDKGWQDIDYNGVSGKNGYDGKIFVKENQVYIAYKDGDCDSKLSVSKYNGYSWEKIGNALSLGDAANINITGNENSIFVSFIDKGENNSIKILKLNL